MLDGEGVAMLCGFYIKKLCLRIVDLKLPFYYR